ncbi:MAG: arylesterase [Pseudomonadota bacterium]
MKLIAFGDSLVAGFGLPQEEGFVPQLEAWLNENGAGPVTVTNAGVSGDTTSGGLARLDWAVTPDADAVLLELGANDMLRGVDPAIAKDNLDQMIARLKARGVPVLLASMPSLGNWGEDYKRDFEALYPALAEKHETPLLAFLGDVAGEENLNQPDGIHPNKRGVAVMVERLGPQIRDFVNDARAEKADG